MRKTKELIDLENEGTLNGDIDDAIKTLKRLKKEYKEYNLTIETRGAWDYVYLALCGRLK